MRKRSIVFLLSLAYDTPFLVSLCLTIRRLLRVSCARSLFGDCASVSWSYQNLRWPVLLPLRATINIRRLLAVNPDLAPLR